MSFARMDEKEKQLALEEEQARLQALKVTGGDLRNVTRFEELFFPAGVLGNAK